MGEPVDALVTSRYSGFTQTKNILVTGVNFGVSDSGRMDIRVQGHCLEGRGAVSTSADHTHTTPPTPPALHQ